MRKPHNWLRLGSTKRSVRDLIMNDACELGPITMWRMNISPVLQRFLVAKVTGVVFAMCVTAEGDLSLAANSCGDDAATLVSDSIEIANRVIATNITCSR